MHPFGQGRPGPPEGFGRGWGMPAPVWGFVQPCVLLLLKRGPQHGYALLDQLTTHGFVGDDVDVGNLYRALRRMEEAGWVRSQWDEAGPRPVKRVYELTATGEAHLKQWAGGLRERLIRLQRFLEEYERAFGPAPDPGRLLDGSSDHTTRAKER
jgi:PadR family transcriptional regulator, regulatory protein PadR